MVPELCEVYSFSHVHQMISTVVGKRTEDAGFKDVVHATFPMGSMTGAPKIAVMQHTETMETFARGIYSGSVGYAYQGEADLNVVIRSLVYDGQRKQLSYAVGGAITIDSIAEEEYQECLDKAATVLSIFDVEMK
jgi:para-aminobenzoate synthetase component 1